MSFAFIILFFALLIWIKAFIHDRISRFVLLSFVAYWCFALFSSTLSPLGLFPISDGTYGVLTLGVLSFVFGMSIVSTNSEDEIEYIRSDANQNDIQQNPVQQDFDLCLYNFHTNRTQIQHEGIDHICPAGQRL